jgi:hypothetical protein
MFCFSDKAETRIITSKCAVIRRIHSACVCHTTSTHAPVTCTFDLVVAVVDAAVTPLAVDGDTSTSS